METSRFVRPIVLSFCLSGLGAASLAFSACSPIQHVTATPAVTRTLAATDTSTPTVTPTPTRTPSPTPGPGLDELMATPLALAAAADLDSAQTAYLDLMDLYPDSVEPLLGLSAIAQRQGDWDSALDYVRRAAEVDPTSQEALRQWALLLEQQGDYASLVKVYDQMAQLVPASADLLVARAMTEARLGQADPAIADLQAAQKLDPYREYAWINVAGAASGLRHYDTAIAIASAGLEAYPETTGLLMERGLAYLSSDQAETAMADFDAVIAADDMQYDAYHWRGRTLITLGRYEEAATDLKKAGELGVLSGAAGVNQAYESMAYAADAIARSDIDGAFSYLKQQVFQYGSRDALLLGYGLVRWRQGSIPLALDYLDGLVASGYVPAFYWRGTIYADDGQNAEAVADLKAFLDTRHFGPDAEAARRLLVSLGEDPDNTEP